MRPLDGPPITIIVRQDTPLQKVFYAFCLHTGVSLSDGRFILDGHICDPLMTFGKLDLEPGEAIDWMPTQAGD